MVGKSAGLGRPLRVPTFRNLLIADLVSVPTTQNQSKSPVVVFGRERCHDRCKHRDCDMRVCWGPSHDYRLDRRQAGYCAADLFAYYVTQLWEVCLSMREHALSRTDRLLFRLGGGACRQAYDPTHCPIGKPAESTATDASSP